MEFRRIEYFLVLAEKLNYAKAASELCISSQALTKQIHLLEEELGTRLFNRTTRSVSLTEDGLLCREKFRPLKMQYDQTLSEVEEAIAQKKKQIRLSFFPPLPRNTFLNRIIAALVSEFGDMDFQIATNTMDGLRDTLKEGKIDLVLTNAHDFEDWSGCSRIVFKKAPAMIVVSPNHPWVKEGKTAITAEDMEASTIVLIEKQEPYEVNSFYGHVKTKQRIMVSDFDAMLIELQKAKGFAVFPMAFNDMEHTDFVCFDLPEEYRFNYRTICSYKQDNRNPAVKKIFQFLEKHKDQFNF